MVMVSLVQTQNLLHICCRGKSDRQGSITALTTGEKHGKLGSRLDHLLVRCLATFKHKVIILLFSF